MDKLLPATSQNNAQTGNSNKPNNETEETFSPSSGTSADSSSSVTVAMENLSTDPDLASGAMDVDEKDKDATTKKPDSNLHHQIKQIKPLLGNKKTLEFIIQTYFGKNNIIFKLLFFCSITCQCYAGPIIYLFDGRSPSRHKQSFFI